MAKGVLVCERTIMATETIEQSAPEEVSLYALRHSAAHIMAEAVMELFPDAKLAIGPPIENGFYYDFGLPRALTPEDLTEIEAIMRRIITEDHPFQYRVVSADEARDLFGDQPYKLELIEGLAHGQDEYGQEGANDTVISTYRQDTFEDLCRGPHLERTGQVPIDGFKLLNVAGAYWRGDEHRPMLQRIYGTAWRSHAELEEYLHKLEQARERDHRRLGKELGLFVFSPDIGSGIPLFLPKGETMRHLMEEYVRQVQTRHGYQHVWTGNLVKRELFERSGHLAHYSDVMFPPMVDENDVYLLKPMNCPSHMTLYNTQYHSYRDLPVRYCEFATLYRYEKSGELMGLTRVRSVTQDDCHIFCTPEGIEAEFTRAMEVIREVMTTYGFTDYRVQLSLRDRDDTAKFVQDEEKWNRAEQALRDALDRLGVSYTPVAGEAAFYGPKADFMAKDVLGRVWQLSTIQIDFIQPARLGCEYIGEDGQPHTPVVIHRAVTGSTERFLGILIEHFAGAFPVWLAPVQAVVIPISAERHGEYAHSVADRLRAAGIRVEVDDRNERMQAKIREAQLQKVPYMLVVGNKEQEAGAVAVRRRSGEDLGAMPLEEFQERIVAESVPGAETPAQ
jgi:threonyl-tRNA synthetase